MPNQTRSKRIALSLTPEVYDVVFDLAELQNKPMSRVVIELMNEMLPVLATVRDGLKEVHESTDKNAALKKVSTALLVEGSERLGRISQEIKKYD